MGFAMVEMLVAVSLIFLVLPGALSVSVKAITTSSYQKDKMIATYLAEEGQELVRSIRDRNTLSILNGSYGDWDTGFGGGLCSATPCKIDIMNETLSTGSGNLGNLALPSDPSYLLYVSANGFYSHNVSGTRTQFYRGVYVTPVGNPSPNEQVLVRSIVVWQTPFGRKKVVSSGFLSNWLQ